MEDKITVDCQFCPDSSQCSANGLQHECPMVLIASELKEMQDFLEVTASDNPVELLNRLTDLNVYMARSGHLLAQAKEIQDLFTANIFDLKDYYIQSLSATMASKYIQSQTATINKLVTWLDRINRTCVHQADNIRTQISFAKMEKSQTMRGAQT